MIKTVNGPGGYRYMPGVSQYSAGVAALDGHRLVRVSFTATVPLARGFEMIAALLGQAGLPLTAFCACELRSPAPFTEQGFRDFNAIYIKTLEDWGVMRDGVNPVARSNVCPRLSPPAEPGFHAFTYAEPAGAADRSFVVAGSGEAPEGHANYRDHAIALQDLSPEGLRKKAAWVLGEMERRMSAFSASWADTTAVQLYTVHDVHPLFDTELGPRGALRNGLTWHDNRPPVVDLEYEMDCRRVFEERVVAA